MELKSLRVERRKDRTLGIHLELSTNHNELQENFRLVKTGGAAPIFDATFAEANRYVGRIRINLNVGNPALQGLSENVTFSDCLKPRITDADVEEALSSSLRLAKPSSAFIRKVLRSVREHFDVQGGCKL